MLKPEIDVEPKARARRTDPATSHEAARKINELQAASIQYRVLKAYARAGRHMTRDEVVEAAGYRPEDGVGVQRRVSELLNAGLLQETGSKRPGLSGRDQRVLSITPAGREALR
jgi:hypothetical protein